MVSVNEAIASLSTGTPVVPIVTEVLVSRSNGVCIVKYPPMYFKKMTIVLNSI